jgi:6-phosphogluconolactonase/glucosamine-6-phosphate isomerase/deaminase
MKKRLVANVVYRKADHQRISITFPVLHSARQLHYFVTDSSKADRVRDVVVSRDNHFPATRTCQDRSEAHFFRNIIEKFTRNTFFVYPV